jgi:3-dehydroquinate dehydratase-2
VELFQSNHRRGYCDAIQNGYNSADGIVINPAAYTHTSVAILDVLRRWPARGGGAPVDVDARENFRQVSMRDGLLCTLQRLGLPDMRMAILSLKKKITGQ